MKILIFLLLIISTNSSSLLALNKQVENKNHKKDSSAISRKSNINYNKLVLEKRIQDSIITGLLGTNVDDKRKIEMYQVAQNANSSIFSGLSTYFTVISILLSIIVVAIPVVNYFLVLRPNKNAMTKIENLETVVLGKIENNFEKYFENLQKSQTKKMIGLLDDRTNLSKVINYFFLNDVDALEAKEIEKVIEFLKHNDDVETTDKYVLNSLVICSDSYAAEKYYKSIFENENKGNYEYAIEYLVKNNFLSHIKYIEQLLKAEDDAHGLLLDIFDYISQNYIGNWNDKKAPEKKQKGIMYAKALFDNQNIINAIAGKVIPIGFMKEHPININRLNDNPFLRETLYYPVYLKEMDDKFKKH